MGTKVLLLYTRKFGPSQFYHRLTGHRKNDIEEKVSENSVTVARVLWEDLVWVRIPVLRQEGMRDVRILLNKIQRPSNVINLLCKFITLRASYSGNTSAFQAEARGSIPLARSIGYNTIVMKSAGATLLIFSFLSIAVFGVSAMGHGAEQSHNGCIAATASGQPCPKNDSSLQFLTFHLNAFLSFSTAVFGQNILSLFLFVASLLLAGMAMGKLFAELDSLDLHSRPRQFLQPSFIHLQPQLIHWLALHENSPATR